MPEKRLSGWAVLATLLNAVLLLMPSILLGRPTLILQDSRLASFILIVSSWIILESFAPQRDAKSSSGCLANLMSAAILALFFVSLTEQVFMGVQAFSLISLLGFSLMVLGIALRFAAIRALAIYFHDAVIVVSGQNLVTSGIYRYVRHPSELGNLCIAFGCPLLLGSLVGLLFSSLFIVAIVLQRILLEDALLRQHFPEQFSAYSRDVPALLPWRLPQEYVINKPDNRAANDEPR
jgi:protein-S-isoprenylcysteine O-methyltransferase